MEIKYAIAVCHNFLARMMKLCCNGAAGICSAMLLTHYTIGRVYGPLLWTEMRKCEAKFIHFKHRLCAPVKHFKNILLNKYVTAVI